MKNYGPSLLVVLALICAPSASYAEDDKPNTESQALAELRLGDDLYVRGKYEDAVAKYQSALKTAANLEAAQAGLAMALLHSGKTDTALQTVIAALGTHPESARLMAVLGKVKFRRGEMSEAEQAFQAALQIDSKSVAAYVGLAGLYRSFSLYAHAYAALKRAHDLDPKDTEVQLMWLQTLPRAERLPAIQAYLAGSQGRTDDQDRLKEYADYLQKTRNDAPHSCKIVNEVDHADLKLSYVHYQLLTLGESELGPVIGNENRRIEGLGLEIKLNNRPELFLLDTGASGIAVDRKAANRAGLKRISDIKYSGIGDQGERTGYLALADNIKIGSLEFRDCVVTVTDKSMMYETDAVGLIGADVFADYLVDIDVPQKSIKLSPLPKRPGDEKTSITLNTEDESPEIPADTQAAQDRTAGIYRPKDRYIAPDMTNWTQAYRFGHMLLVPTRLNASKPVLFLVDTGAFDNMLSTRAAQGAGKVDVSPLTIEGASGRVSRVYRAEKVDLQFSRFHQLGVNTVAFDLSTISNSTGTEISGTLGFGLLSMLDIKIDYRDGLVDFVYRDNHGTTH